MSGVAHTESTAESAERFDRISKRVIGVVLSQLDLSGLVRTRAIETKDKI